MGEVRLRFAPSPTGFLHIGGLRTALYNYLYARQQGGKFILRIEDTDQTRFVPGALESLIRSLKWAGIDYDEGVYLEDGELVERGEYGPYIQSDRVKAGIYNKYIEELLESGKAYYCFCSKERLDHLRKQQEADGKLSRYDGLCRGVSLEEARKRVAAGEPHVVRLRMPENELIQFHDVVKGDITVNSNDVDDQVLIKADGFPTYHFAVIVDDHLMGITHIARGDEWVSSVPKHVYLYNAFGWEIPEFVHLPVILNQNHKKLSKRHDDVSVEDFIEQGYLPEGLVNYLAMVGWSPNSNQEIFSMEELIEQFTFNRVNSTGGIFDRKKLDWVNAHHIREKSVDEIRELARPFLVEAGVIPEDFEDNEFLNRVIAVYQDGMHTLKDLIGPVKMAMADVPEYTEETEEVIASGEGAPLYDVLEREVMAVDEVDADLAAGLMKTIQKETGIKGKNLYMPVRGAMIGNVHGPDMTEVFLMLGKDKILKRIEKARNTIRR